MFLRATFTPSASSAALIAPFIFPIGNGQILGLISQFSSDCFWKSEESGCGLTISQLQKSDEIFAFFRQGNLSCPMHQINWFHSAEADLQHFLDVNFGL